MYKKTVIIILVMLTIPIAILGCSGAAQSTPTIDPGLIYTAAAQTADARLTQIFQSTPSATPIPPSPTVDFVQTMAAQTAAALASQAATQTPTSQTTQALTQIPTSAGGDKAAFVADVTIPDGTLLAPGAAFTKTWKLQNAGTTTWTTSYSLVFVSGEDMGTVKSVPLSTSVAPGAQIDVSVDMLAPNQNGNYQSWWKMKNASGQFFNDSVYVLITVGTSGTSQPTSTTAPGATVTATGSPTNPVSSLSMTVDHDTYNGACPYTFNFTATIVLSRGATLTYGLEAGSDTPGFQFDLPSPVTSTFGPGTYPLPFPMEFTDSGSGWVRLHITSPVDMTSNEATFNLTCTP
jgi:hypothetical protein